MSVAALKLIRLDHARLAMLLRDNPAHLRREALERAFPGALGAACFGAPASWPLLADAAPDWPLAPGWMTRLIPAATPAAERDDTCFEIWQCDARDLVSGREGPLHYRFSESAGIVFGCVSMFEADVGIERAPGVTPLERASYAAYEAIFRVLDTLGMRHPLRIWNVVAAINDEQHGSERYRQFNTGRQRAFLDCGRPVIGSVPAASALGAPVALEGDTPAAVPLVVSFLAARSASDAIENPRQISAYHYPAQYGPSAPIFARASAWPRPGEPVDESVLFVSGTASIVGHETVHRGDVLAQLRETLANINAVLKEATRKEHGRTTLSDLTYKVYVREPADARMLAAIDETLREACGSPPRALYLHADICRSDLLLEIEASGGHGVEVLG